MGWWRTLFRAAQAPTLDRNETAVRFSVPIDPKAPLDSLLRRVDGLSAPVGRARALSVPAVLRGRNLLCSIGTLPLVTRDKNRGLVRSQLLEQIDPATANVVTLAQTVEDLVFEGISWWRVLDRTPAGFPRSAVHLDHDTVSMQPPPGFPRLDRTLPSGVHLPGGVVWVNGEAVSGRDVIRFDSPNPPFLVAAARAIRRAILLEQAAAMYANDPRPSDYFTPADGADPIEDDEVEELLSEWQEARRTRTTAYVPAALSYSVVQSPTPADLQLVELQRQVTVEIANAFGLDSEDLQVSTTSRSYANVIDRRRDRINDVLAPYMLAITDRLTMNDVTRRGQTVAFDLDNYLKSNPTERWATYQTGLANHVLSVPEVREMEGLPAVPVEPAPSPQRTQPPQETQETGMSLTYPKGIDEYVNRERITAHFNEDRGTTRITFDVSAAEARFSVDAEKRTVSGLLVPWSKTAWSNYAKWSFSKDSLKWTDASRVKLNREHDRAQAVGYALKLESTDEGLVGTFKIARGAAGDEVLSLAEDKVLDGFSIEADFEDGSWGRDPDDDMVRLVSSARLVGTAITAAPAFDDARVTSVAASRKGTEMTGEPKGKQETPAAAPDAATVAAFTAAVEAFTNQNGKFADAIANLVEQQQGGERPEVIDPTKRTAQFHVNEAPLYRFDGSRGEHDFSTDVIAMSKKDHEAEARVVDWIKDNFAPSAAFVKSSDVGSLNPARQRPDLYVDELQYPTPLWDSINKGTLDDNTPFVLPKFAASGNLVDDHTEGVEPTTGTFTTTSQTITPSAVSGKVEITREAWDQGGNPQLSVILWRQIVRKYYEALEEASAALLQSLAPATITLTAGAVDKALGSEVKKALAALQFVRGGFRFRDFKLEQGLYTNLADAKDDNGRPLYPILNAQNADGTASPLFAALSIAGLAGVPSWALPYTAGSPSNSYLYDREDVHGWASAPQRLDFEYRVAYVDIGVWGYKALACTRVDGVRRIAYDTTAA
ncbi:phage portal protein [Amycolatopsis sp. Poz14]|uniref:phage portal protein n=1 Tax=Amycolatopsis sp. Poz14 TaxID=1447705 RepID=UPI001EE99845|nr:phage portal protein [Amycolatopsis sp. Poz14]MCG3757376.1 phage portal protein [Amycolatopsis sp. Poz14]